MLLITAQDVSSKSTEKLIHVMTYTKNSYWTSNNEEKVFYHSG